MCGINYKRRWRDDLTRGARERTSETADKEDPRCGLSWLHWTGRPVDAAAVVTTNITIYASPHGPTLVSGGDKSRACGCASHTAAGPRVLAVVRGASYRISVGTHARARALLARRRCNAFSPLGTRHPARPRRSHRRRVRASASVCVGVCLCVFVCLRRAYHSFYYQLRAANNCVVHVRVPVYTQRRRRFRGNSFYVHRVTAQRFVVLRSKRCLKQSSVYTAVGYHHKRRQRSSTPFVFFVRNRIIHPRVSTIVGGGSHTVVYQSIQCITQRRTCFQKTVIVALPIFIVQFLREYKKKFFFYPLLSLLLLSCM